MRHLLKIKNFSLTLAVAFIGISATAQTENLKLHYTFEDVTGTSVPDVSASATTATVKNQAKVFKMGKYYALDLGNGSGYLDMGKEAGEIVKELADFSVSAYYYVDPSASLSGAGYFLWAFSTQMTNTSTDGPYSAYRLNAQRFATSTGGWNNETGMEKGSEAEKGKWSHVLYRQAGKVGELYVDGKLVQKVSTMPVLNQAFTTAPAYNWIGRAPFSGDSYLKNTYVTDFRVYDIAVSDDELKSLASKTSELEYEYKYGDPGDFTALKNLTADCEKFIAEASGKYLQNALDELQDEITIANSMIAAGIVSQTVIDNHIANMQGALDNVKATEGITFGEVSHFIAGDHGFVHPGGLHTQADFDRVKDLLAKGDPTITAAMALLRSNEYSQAGVLTWPVETIIRGGSSGQNYINACRGAAMAYQNALRWKIDGTRANADGAVRILMAWARGNKYVSGDTNMSLAAGLTGYQFAQAAELMRDYEGWSREEFEEFKRYMLKTWYPVACDFLRRRHDTWANWANSGKGERPGHYWSNWGLCNVLCLMHIGILCDDVHIYNQGVSFYKYDHVGTFVADRTNSTVILNDGCNEFIGNLVPVVHPDDRGPLGYLGQMQESGRDQGHALMAAGLAVDICQTGYNQGEDLYAYMDDRLAAGLEYVAAMNYCGVSGSSLPWTNYNYTDCRGWMGAGWQMEGPNEGGIGGWRPYWDRVVGYYEGVRGVKMQYSGKAAQIVRGDAGTDGGGGNYGQTSGGFDHLGFTTLMDYRPAITADKAPVILSGQIVYNGETLDQTNLGGLKYNYVAGKTKAIPAEGTVTLVPILPEGVSDNGSWKWETGETTKDITVNADHSYVYRVHYTADNGVVSSQAFSIAVAGDCNPDVLYPEITIDGTIYADTVMNVLYGESVILYAGNTTGWTDDYQWSNGKTGSVIVIPNITSDRTYTVHYTNQGGNVSAKNFHLKVINGVQNIIVDNNENKNCSEIMVNPGQSVELTLTVPETMSYGEYTWSDGSKEASITLNDIQTSCEYSVEYVISESEKLNFTYHILVTEKSDRLVDVADYYIIDRASGKYLTNHGDGTSPSFAEKDETAPLSQTWNITRASTARYDIISMLDSTWLDKSGALKAKTYKPHRIQAAAGTMYVAIHNSASSGNIYWVVNEDGTVNYEGAPSLYGYPFELVEANPIHDAIDNVSTDRQAAVVRVQYFSLNGTRLSTPQNGINIRKQYLSDGNVITDKIIVR
ncbi:MAG: LamG domain-containing protein [Bacteroides sp.]|nr:LamG domain-containing protein [Roseburia sp.]MCM1346669.1 LamG domain-containing protein [Bacteroides sp.]MCM1421626.1 LamG domain-containing protein [Bacteroides sp.]